MATWRPEVAADFDEQPPAVHDLAVTHNGHLVVALVFETGRVPFVVRNAAHGQQGGGGGPVEREVPWRDGTSVRSAKHSDLVRLLLPVADLPRLALQKATAELSERKRNTSRELYIAIFVTVYAMVPLGTAVTLPNHQARKILHTLSEVRR